MYGRSDSITNHKKTNSDKHFILSELGLIACVIVLLIFGFFCNGSLHPRASYEDHVEMSIRAQSLSLEDSDRISHHLSRVPNYNRTQKIANRKALQVYHTLNTEPKYSRYSIHDLDSNGIGYQHNKLSHKLEAKAHAEYGINCAEISFGKRHFKNMNHRWQPYRNVKTSWGLADLVNNHFMRYDQASHNVHRNNILNRHNTSVGVSALYNSKNNRGVLVEVYRESPHFNR